MYFNKRINSIGRIYKITNLINNKVYVGQTVMTLKERWWGHCSNLYSKAQDMIIKRAIKKYGKENFRIELIEECPIEEIDDREIYWIKEYDSYYNGYNATIGGSNHSKMMKLYNQAEEIIKLYETGFSLREIARQYNVDHATINYLLRKFDIAIRATRTYKYTPNERQEIMNEFLNGVSRKEIMKKWKISHSYLSQLINGNRNIITPRESDIPRG